MLAQSCDSAVTLTLFFHGMSPAFHFGCQQSVIQRRLGH